MTSIARIFRTTCKIAQRAKVTLVTVQPREFRRVLLITRISHIESCYGTSRNYKADFLLFSIIDDRNLIPVQRPS